MTGAQEIVDEESGQGLAEYGLILVCCSCCIVAFLY